MTSSRLPLHGTWARSVAGEHIDFVPVPGNYRPAGQCALAREFRLPNDLITG